MRLLTPAALRSVVCHDEKVALAGLSGLRAHPRLLLLASLIAGIAPLFGFTAIALGLVGYVTTIFKLSALFTILWAKLYLGEGQIRERLLGDIGQILHELDHHGKVRIHLLHQGQSSALSGAAFVHSTVALRHLLQRQFQDGSGLGDVRHDHGCRGTKPLVVIIHAPKLRVVE